MPSAAPARRPNAAMSPARGDGRRRAMRTRNSVAPIIAAANGMSLVWLNMAPYHAPQSAQRDRGDQARARTRDQSRGRRSGADPADAHHRAEDMTQIIGIDRDQMAEGDGDDVEQAAIEIKVFEGEDALVPEAAAIIGDDQFAVVMLHAFIVGDRVVLEGAQRDDDERGDQRDGGDITGVEARDRSYRLAPGQGLLRNARKALPGQLRRRSLIISPAKYASHRCSLVRRHARNFFPIQAATTSNL